jgi:hypothetical protein
VPYASRTPDASEAKTAQTRTIESLTETFLNFRLQPDEMPIHPRAAKTNFIVTNVESITMQLFRADITHLGTSLRFVVLHRGQIFSLYIQTARMSRRLSSAKLIQTYPHASVWQDQMGRDTVF